MCVQLFLFICVVGNGGDKDGVGFGCNMCGNGCGIGTILYVTEVQTF